MEVLDGITQEINKIRWKKWREKQKTEREKTYFHCWSNWSDYCEDSDSNPTSCAYAYVEATLYASSNSIKVHYYAACCGHPDCGGCALYRCYVRIKICGPGYCSVQKGT